MGRVESAKRAEEDHDLKKNHFHSRGNYIINSIPQCITVLVLLVLCSGASSVQSIIVKTLPGYPGDLPFTLETGYVSVGESDDVHLFYYFIESEGNPREDPLVLWLTGGPGCSAFSGLVYEIGPLCFDTEHFDGNFPNFTLNPYSWTKVANVIFLDAPVGTGFSYANYWEGYVVDDQLSATETYNFLMKWLLDHPQFLSNDLYIAGDSYSGMIVPVIVQMIYGGNNNEVGVQPPTKLTGYILGNPLTHEHDDPNSRVEFAHRLALISDGLYQSSKANCHGEYLNVDPNNTACTKDLTIITQCLSNIDGAQILEPNCALRFPNPNKLKWDRRLIEEGPEHFLLPPPQVRKLWCRNYNYVLSDIWANDMTVQKALHVRKGSITKWVRCNKTMSYSEDMLTSIECHRNLSHTDLRALIYSGDHDMAVPYISTHKWIESLALPVDDDWRPWFVEGQVAGYTMKYVEKGYHLTFATVKGGGHTAPEYKPAECLHMVERWFAYYAL